MQKFFHSIDEIGRFIGNLRPLQRSCPHCDATNTLCSHGFIHKFGQFNTKHLVGKRVYCSNRYQKNGCGRTFQLYLADFIPRLHFSIADFETEIQRYLHFNISDNPQENSIRRCNVRTRFRWFRKLENRIPVIREALIKSNPLSLNLPGNASQSALTFTLLTLFSSTIKNLRQFQLNTQKGII